MTKNMKRENLCGPNSEYELECVFKLITLKFKQPTQNDVVVQKMEDEQGGGDAKTIKLVKEAVKENHSLP